MVACILLAVWSMTEQASAAAPNDDFANAELLQGLPTQGTGDLVDATLEPGEPRPTAVKGNFGSLWYKWTAPRDGSVSLTQPDFATRVVFGVFTGSSLASLIEVASATLNDVGGGGTSELKLPVEDGMSYMIAVSTVRPSPDEHSFTLRLDPAIGRAKVRVRPGLAPFGAKVKLSSDTAATATLRAYVEVEYGTGSEYFSYPKHTVPLAANRDKTVRLKLKRAAKQRIRDVIRGPRPIDSMRVLAYARFKGVQGGRIEAHDGSRIGQ